MKLHLMDTPWHNLQHAYGEASEVPRWLTGIQSHDEDTRQEAWANMFGSVVHQGTLYSSTPHVIPHLLILLQDTSIPERKEIIWFLAVIATGESAPAMHGDPVREQLRENLPLFRKLMLHDPDPVVRRNIPKVLVELPGATGFAWQVLHEALLQESDVSVQALCLSSTLELLLRWEGEGLPQEGQPLLDLLPHFHQAQEAAALRLVSRLLTMRFVDRRLGLLPQLLEDFQAGCTEYEGWDEGGMEYFIHKALESDPELVQVWFQLLLQNSSARVRVQALQNMRLYIGQFRGVEAQACQMAQVGLQDPDEEVRFQASLLIRSLGHLAHPLKMVLQDALRDPSVRVRCNALMSLGHLHEPELHSHIVHFALSCSFFEVQAAVDTMQMVWGKYPETQEHFTRLLQYTDEELEGCITDVPDWQHAKDVRFSLIHGLRFTSRPLPEGLAQMLQPELHAIALRVFHATESSNAGAVDQLMVHLLNHPHRLLDQLWNLHLSTPTVLAALKKLLEHENQEVRAQAAANWWDHTGDSDTVRSILLTELGEMLKDPDWTWTKTLMQVVRALFEMQALPAEPHKWLKKPQVSGWYWHADLLQTLWQVNRNGAWMKDALLDGLRHQNSYRVALQILQEMPDLSQFREGLELLIDQRTRVVAGVSDEVVWHDEALRCGLLDLLSQQQRC